MLRWLFLAAMASAAVEAAPMTADRTGAAVPPARDGNIAIRQELCAARKAGTIAAYDLFIARHPDHPLAETARRERAAMAKEKR